MVSVAHLGSRPPDDTVSNGWTNTPKLPSRPSSLIQRTTTAGGRTALDATAREIGYPNVDEDTLFEYDLDHLLSTLYFEIADEELLDHPTYGGVNLHQVELPRYRGSNTFSHAIVNARDDDRQYGATCHFMSPEVDTGDVIDRNLVEITEENTTGSLYEKTSLEVEKEITPGQFEAMNRDQLYDRIRALDFPPFEPAHLKLGDGKIYLTKSLYGEVTGG